MNAGRWTTVRILAPQDRPALIRALFEIGAEGVQELDSELVTHLRDLDERYVLGVIRSVDPSAVVEFAETPDVDWSAAWKERIKAHRLGALVVTPPWLAADYLPNERVVIDPGMAFGTGEHETTRGVIRLIQQEGCGGKDVADIGAGSAVLSIAAAKLGARRVVAVEVDADAIGNAEENVERNEVSDRVAILEGDAFVLLPLVAPVHLVLANIVSSVLIELLPTMEGALHDGGAAILSGILVEERSAMENALSAAGWRVERTDREGAWWSALVRRK